MKHLIAPMGGKWVIQAPDGRVYGPYHTIDVAKQELERLEPKPQPPPPRDHGTPEDWRQCRMRLKALGTLLDGKPIVD